MLGEGFLVEDLDGVAEHDRMRYLHHGRLDVQRQHHAGLARIFKLLFVKFAQGLLAHEHAVDDFAGLQGNLGLEDGGLAALADQFHFDVARGADGHGFFTVVEVAMLHVRHVAARGHAPLAHAVRVLTGETLDRCRRAAVGIALAQDRVDGAAEHLGVALQDFFFFVGLRIFRQVRNRIAARLQFADRGLQLRHRGADVRQLDDVGVRILRQLAQRGEVVRDTLFGCQTVREFGQDPRGHRDIAFNDVDAGRRGERPDDGQQRVGRQQRRLISQRIDDGGIISSHGDVLAGLVFDEPSRRLPHHQGGRTWRSGRYG